MYSNKKSILQLAALLERAGIDHIVLSPGSRNAPLIHTFAEHPFFRCYPVVDERSAAFYALGMIQQLQRPAAVCCTSGTALLNYASAVAEAFYQELPLLVISADRPPAWIGQMDGQTLPQPGVFGSLVKKSVQVPEIRTPEDAWHANRLINEALLALEHHGRGPVHINLPLSEPLFEFTEPALPPVRQIRLYAPHTPPPQAAAHFRADWRRFRRRMILVGQASLPEETREQLRRLARNGSCVVLAEHTGNIGGPAVCSNFDALLYTLQEEEKAAFAPDLLVTLGGHVVSKRIKQLLRSFLAQVHWHIGAGGEVADSFQSLTCLAEGDALPLLRAAEDTVTGTEFADERPFVGISAAAEDTGAGTDTCVNEAALPAAAQHDDQATTSPMHGQPVRDTVRKDKNIESERSAGMSAPEAGENDRKQPAHNAFVLLWKNRTEKIERAVREMVAEGLPFSDLFVAERLLAALPGGCALHLANSSSVRNVQLFPLKPGIEVFCNRGTSGIDGSMSTAAGYARLYPGPVFLLIGDLSFRYDINCLLDGKLPENLHILLVDNRGGQIFRILPGLNRSDKLEEYVCQGVDEALLRPFAGKVCRSAEETEEAIAELADGVRPDGQPVVQVVTSGADNAGIFRNFYRRLKAFAAGAE